MSTIKDVARLAGVGLGTASRVISGHGSVAPATVERVRKAIEELDFRPSHAARSLLSGSSQMIGVYIPVLKGTFFTPILRTIDTELRANGQHMVVAFGSGSGSARRQAREGMAFLQQRGCDGLVVISNALLAGDLAGLGTLRGKVVLLNHRIADVPDQCFILDHRQGGVLAARTLLQREHRNFAVIAGPPSAPDNVERISAFMTELEANGIDPGQVAIAESDFSPEGGWEGARKLLARGRTFTALFCANDETAVGALSYFQHAGIDVPGAISVLGYDDTESAEYSAPRLTSIHIPWRELTLNGLRWLLNQCYDASHSIDREFQVAVSWRDSVRAVVQ